MTDSRKFIANSIGKNHVVLASKLPKLLKLKETFCKFSGKPLEVYIYIYHKSYLAPHLSLPRVLAMFH